MPRSYALNRTGQQLTSNPLNTLVFDPTSTINSGQSALTLPSDLELLEELLTGWITFFFKVPQAPSQIANTLWTSVLTPGSTSDNWMADVITNAANAWNNWETTFNATEQATIADLTAWWKQSQEDATNAWNNWETTLNDLGQETIDDLTTWWNDIETYTTNAWNSIFGTPTPGGGQQILQSAVQDLEDIWNNIFGTTTPGGSTEILQSAIQDLENIWNNIFGIGKSPTSSKIPATSITGLIESLREQLSGHGALTATIKVSQFIESAKLAGHGALVAQGTTIIPGYKFAEPGNPVGHGALTGTSFATEFRETPHMVGRGLLVAQSSVIYTSPGVVGSEAPTLHGAGTLSVVANASKFTVKAALSGHGAQAGQATTVVYSPRFAETQLIYGHGALTASAASTKFSVAGRLTGRGVFAPTPAGLITAANIPSLTTSWGGHVASGNISSIFGNSSLGADLQALVDMFNNAFTGSATTNNPLSVIETNLQNLWNSLFGGSTVTSNGGQTIADTQAARKAQNDLIIGDWFHTTYPLGTSSDTASTTVGGKRTWWGAWNDNLALLGTMLGITAPTDPASDVGTTAAASATNVQNVADALHQAAYGGGATGNATDLATLVSAQTTVPAANVVPPANPSSTGIPVYGASSNLTAATSTSATTLTASGSHTGATGDNFVGMFAMYSAVATAGATGITRTALYGTQTMNSLTGPITIITNGNQGFFVEYFGLTNPASGAQTTSLTVTSTFSAAVYGISGSLDSYSGVVSVDASPATATGFGTSLAVSKSSSSNYMAVGGFAGVANGTRPNIALTNHTQRNLSSGTTPSFNGFIANYCFGDGSANASFTATASSSSCWWAGIALNLVGAGSVPLGSVMNAVNTSTSTVSPASSANTWVTFAANMWPTLTGQVNSPDGTYSATTNTFTAEYTGTYLISIGAQYSTSLTSQTMGLGVRKNGSLYRTGPVVYVSNNSSTTPQGAQFCVPIYLNTGDTITPVFIASIASVALWTGESSGSRTYFTVALENRSYL